MIMAVGTMASRLTGQIRSILLAAAIGTTGIAANAYQTGSMIPQVVFTLISGGIFNAVLVPQIVRTLKHKDANDRLSKLITLSIALLLGITVIMMLATPLVTMLYVNPNWRPEQRALVNAFTLWCMPQIFFYGLYLVLGQILAAKDRFGMYAWSSVGANVISCAGFTAFILMFGNASRQPMGFWTDSKIALTAGTWTLGVAFQALVLFIPLMRLGLKYRVRWGLHGIGLRSMGKVAIWSLALTVLNLLVGMVNSQVNTGAPHAGGDLYGIAGNGSYQYAYSLYILPYSLITVSITTAVFPKLSRAISDHDLDTARQDLSSSIRSVGLAMFFFAAAMIAMPVPITRALLPSVNVHDSLLIAGPLIGLSIGLVPISIFLLVQRAFYAFEDGKSPFLFALLNNAVQIVVLISAVLLLAPRYWATAVGAAISVAYIVTFPIVFIMLRKRIGGHLDGHRIVIMHAKAGVAAVVTGLAGWQTSLLTTKVLGANISTVDGHLSWLQSLLVCIAGSIVMAVVYAIMLKLLRVQEFTDLVDAVMRRLKRRGAQPEIPAEDTNSSDGDQVGTGGKADANTPPTEESADASSSTDADKPADTEAEADSSQSDDGGIGDINAAASVTTDKPNSEVFADARPSTIPTNTMARKTFTPLNPTVNERSTVTMNPGLGDTLIDRYTLVASLYEGDGLSVWRANDGVMAKDCQLFLITDMQTVEFANTVASSLALSHNPRFTPILQLRKEDNACIIVTELDAGISLQRYLAHNAQAAERALSWEAIRTIIGETLEAVKSLRAVGLNHRAVSTATIRITSRGITLADAPVSAALITLALGHDENPDMENVVIRQIAATLFETLTGMAFAIDADIDPAVLAEDIPDEFRIICMRGLGLHSAGTPKPVPISTLNELSALLGSWKPVSELGKDDIDLASRPSAQSIELVTFKPVPNNQIAPLPTAFQPYSTKPDLAERAEQAQEQRDWRANQLLFPTRNEVDEVKAGSDDADFFSAFDSPAGESPVNPTIGLDVSSVRHPQSQPHISDTPSVGSEGNLDAVNGSVSNGAHNTVASGETGTFTPSIATSSTESVNSHRPLINDESEGEATIVMAPLSIDDQSQMVMPPSYAPRSDETEVADFADDADSDNETQDNGKHTLRNVGIGVLVVLILAGIAFGAASALGLFNGNHENKQSNPWPSINTSDVDYPSQAQTESSTPTPSATTSSKTATPTPTKNTTAYPKATQAYIYPTDSYDGRGWYVHLKDAHSIQRVVINIPTSGGQGHIYAGGTKDNPTGGKKVADFTFAEGGTTEVEIKGDVKTQDLTIWVPTSSLPGGGLSFNQVQVY